MHLYLAFLPHRDYFGRPGCISILPFYPTGIISAAPDASLFCPINDFHDRITKSSKSGGQMPPLRFILSENVRKIFSMCLRTFRRLLRQSFHRLLRQSFRRPLCQSFCRSFRALFYANFTAVFSAISIISVKLSWRSCAERATGLKR